jgi:hypothetical protein
MNDILTGLDQTEEETLFSSEVSDEALEAAAGSKTQVCFYPSQSGIFDPGLDCTCFSAY